MARKGSGPLGGLVSAVSDYFGAVDTGGDPGVTPHRESNFNRASGRFHDPDTGAFEIGGPPPDLDPSVDRYRAKDGRFKKRAADLYDEPDEARMGELWPRG
jgi:hypothetical protein